MTAEDEKRLTDVVNTEQLFRIIHDCGYKKPPQLLRRLHK
jgi:hypothetical protein